MQTNIIYNEDCIGENGMSILPDKSVDMILADLPYGTTKNKWDIIIPFEPLWNQYLRIIKNNGAIVLFGQGLFSAKLMLSQEKLFKYTLVWEKNRPSGFLNAKKMPLRSHEDILVFYKKPPVYNPQMWEGEPSHSIGRANDDGVQFNNNNYGNFTRVDRAGTDKYPRSVLKFDRPHPPIHPTQKSVELCEWLIKTYTNEEEVVLDNVMGSATTAIASINTKRKYIGWELNSDYYAKSMNRITEHIE